MVQLRIGCSVSPRDYLEQVVAIAHFWEGWRIPSPLDPPAVRRVSALLVAPPADHAGHAA